MTETRRRDSSTGFQALAFFTADHAVIENGKAYINGGFFDRVFDASYPLQISIAVVALIKVSSEEYLRDHRFAVELEDARGEKLDLRIEGDFRVAPSPQAKPGESAVMPLAIPLNGLSLERAGDYSFVLSINGREIARYELHAMQMGLISQQFQQIPTGDNGDPQEG